MEMPPDLTDPNSKHQKDIYPLTKTPYPTRDTSHSRANHPVTLLIHSVVGSNSASLSSLL